LPQPKNAIATETLTKSLLLLTERNQNFAVILCTLFWDGAGMKSHFESHGKCSFSLSEGKCHQFWDVLQLMGRASGQANICRIILANPCSLNKDRPPNFPAIKTTQNQKTRSA